MRKGVLGRFMEINEACKSKVAGREYIEMPQALKEQLTDWVFGPLSVRQPEFGGMSPCPYAAEAVLNRQVGFYSSSCDITKSLESLLEEFPWLDQRVAIMSFNPGKFGYEATAELVAKLREKHYVSDLWLMFDHPSQREFVGRVNLSFEKTTLFFVQRLTDVCESSDALHLSGYYSNWSVEYYEKVVAERKRFLNRLKT